MEEEGGLNLYVFGGNNLISNWDFLGLFEEITHNLDHGISTVTGLPASPNNPFGAAKGKGSSSGTSTMPSLDNFQFTGGGQLVASGCSPLPWGALEICGSSSITLTPEKKCCDKDNAEVRKFVEGSGSITIRVQASPPSGPSLDISFNAGGTVREVPDCPDAFFDADATFRISGNAEAYGFKAGAGCENTWKGPDSGWTGWSCDASIKFGTGGDVPDANIGGGVTLSGNFISYLDEDV